MLSEHFPARTAPNLAIVALYPGTKDLTPWDDESYDIWCMNDHYSRGEPGWIKRHTMWWEPHDYSVIYQNVQNKTHLEWLKQCSSPLMLFYPVPELPDAHIFPKDEVFAEFGTKYISSTIAFQIIAAYAMGYERVELYGFNMGSDGDYFKQRPNFEYWFGRLKERGLRIILPEDCEMVRGDLYAYETTHQSILTVLGQRVRRLEEIRNTHREEFVKAEGQLELLGLLEQAGVEVPLELKEDIAHNWRQSERNTERYTGAFIEASDLKRNLVVYGGHRG